MSKIDPRLIALQARAASSQESALREERLVVRPSSGTEETVGDEVEVLVRYSGDVGALRGAGMRVRTVAGPVAVGSVPLARLGDLEALPEVAYVEGAVRLQREINVSGPEIGLPAVHGGVPPYRGDGVVVGIVDGAVDFMHENFQSSLGDTRFLRIWHQGLTPLAGESSPAAFGYGVEYDAAKITTAMAATNPYAVVRIDADDHGTHVAGIAAGDGSLAGQGLPANTFVGMAPEASIIAVAASSNGSSMGDSSSVIDAVKYIIDAAKALGRPVAINMSLGDNIGPHDGTSLVEVGLDALLVDKGAVLVKSAGNQGNTRRHAAGSVGAGDTQAVRVTVPGNSALVELDLWYDGADRFTVTVVAPDGTATAAVAAGGSGTTTLGTAGTVTIDSTVHSPLNGDNRLFITLDPGATGGGTWTVRITGATVTTGRWHAWLERHSTASFPADLANANVTLTIPGTGHRVITVASYVNQGAGAGTLSSFSSRGPTRDGRAAPTLAAPGERVVSCDIGDGGYYQNSGTSMAAPHVAGVAALMLDKNPHLTADDIRQGLQQTARTDVNTGAVPNHSWGHGKLSADGAVDHVSLPTTLPLTDVGTLAQSDTLRLSDTHIPIDVMGSKPARDTTPIADLVTLPIVDSPGTAPLLDAGGTFPPLDVSGTAPVPDWYKSPGLDKSPASDLPGPMGPGGFRMPPVPFAVATPHHAAVDTRRESEAAALERLHAVLPVLLQGQQGGSLLPDEERALEQLLSGYQRLTGAGG